MSKKSILSSFIFNYSSVISHIKTWFSAWSQLSWSWNDRATCWWSATRRSCVVC